MSTKPEPTDLVLSSPDAMTPDKAISVTPLAILEAAVNRGITSENVAVVKELVQLAREQRADEAKAEFARAFFQLTQAISKLEIYADKQAKTRSGEVAYTYCSEKELDDKLRPVLMQYGFGTLFGQTENNGRITITLTIMHQAGHQEVREYTVRAGHENAMKDAAACDTGAATTAYRHLCIKMFGLKSRIQEGQDATKDGEKIGPDKVQYLIEQCQEVGGNLEARLLEAAGVSSLDQIGSQVYPIISRIIEWAKKKKTKGAP